MREICFWATLCGGRPSSSSPFQRMLPDCGPVDAGEAVEQRRLAGAVGPDQPGDLARAACEHHPVEGDDAAEADRHVIDDEADTGRRCPTARARSSDPTSTSACPRSGCSPLTDPFAVPHVVSPVSSSRPLPPDRPGSRHSESRGQHSCDAAARGSAPAEARSAAEERRQHARQLDRCVLLDVVAGVDRDRRGSGHPLDAARRRRRRSGSRGSPGPAARAPRSPRAPATAPEVGAQRRVDAPRGWRGGA